MERIVCQSCAMPLEKPEDYGSEADGGRNTDYCCHCYRDGGFANDFTMDEMIALNAEYTGEWDPEMPREEAVRQMKAFFPSLKRWREGA